MVGLRRLEAVRVASYFELPFDTGEYWIHGGRSSGKVNNHSPVGIDDSHVVPSID